MIRELIIVITTLFAVAVYYISMGPVISILDSVMTSPEIGAQNAVGGSLLSWLPYLLFIIVPGLIIVTAVAYALSWAGKNEAKVGGGRRR